MLDSISSTTDDAGAAAAPRPRAENDKVRLNLVLSRELSGLLDEIADSASASRTDVIRQALALMNVAHRAKKEGRHIGLVDDRTKLDSEIVGLL